MTKKQNLFLNHICLFACLLDDKKETFFNVHLFVCLVDHKTSLPHGFGIFPFAKNARLLN